MSSPAQTSFGAKLAEKEAQLKALETRTALQIQKLADNNSALARMNHRLGSQVDRLKTDMDHLEHLAAGQAAVARAKESELASEINGLKHLLKESLSERATLHAQLVAKQEIVRYLEWRLAQMEQLAEGKERASGGGGPLSAAFKEAAHIASGEPPLDSFPVLSDTSIATQSSSNSGTNLPRTLLALGQRGLVGIPTTAWAPAAVEDEAEKENANARPPPRPTADTITPGTVAVNPGQFTPLRSSVRSALGDITPNRRRPRAAAGDDNPTPTLVSVVAPAAAAVAAPVVALAVEELAEEKPEEDAPPILADVNSFMPVQDTVDDAELALPSELEGSSTAGAPSADLKKQLFAEYSSADLQYIDNEDEDDVDGEDNGISVRAAVAALEKKAANKKKKKRDDGLDVKIDQMHTPIAQPSQQSQQQQEQHHQNQTAAATTATTPKLFNNITSRKKNNDDGGEPSSSPPAQTPPLYSPSATPATGLRSSSRVRRSVSYALPPVNRKLRQGDPFTFGDPTTTRKKNPSSSGNGNGGGSSSTLAVPRSRTKPRAKYASSYKKPRRKSLSIRSTTEDTSPNTMATPLHVGVLPAMAEQEDYSEEEGDAADGGGSGGAGGGGGRDGGGDSGGVEVIFS